MASNFRGSSPGSIISAFFYGATGFPSLSTNMQSRPSCPADRSPSSKKKVGQVKADRRRAGDGDRFQLEVRAATRAVIVHVERKRRQAGERGERDAASRLLEAVELAKA